MTGSTSKQFTSLSGDREYLGRPHPDCNYHPIQQTVHLLEVLRYNEVDSDNDLFIPGCFNYPNGESVSGHPVSIRGDYSRDVIGIDWGMIRHLEDQGFRVTVGKPLGTGVLRDTPYALYVEVDEAILESNEMRGYEAAVDGTYRLTVMSGVTHVVKKSQIDCIALVPPGRKS